MAAAYFSRNSRLLNACIFIIAAVVMSCGGPSFNPVPQNDDNWPAHDWNGGARSGSYVAVAVDAQDNVIPDVTAKLALEVEPTGTGERVRVLARGLEACRYIGLHLRYERQLRHPRQAQCGRGWEEKTLFLGVTNMPGAVAIGISAIGDTPLLTGDMVLAEVDFDQGPFVGERRPSALCVTPVSDLAWDGATAGLLHWNNNSPADTNQDSVVNTADVAPLGIHFGKDSSAADWAAAQVADTNRNNIINIADLAAIGIHFQERVTGFQVVDCDTQAGQFDPIAGATLAFSSGVIPGGGGFRRFSYQLAGPVEGRWYAVVAMEDANLAAVKSNALQYSTSGPQPPLNLRGSSDGTNIQLVWDPPASGTPDSYDIFVSNAGDMSSPFKVNPSPVLTPQYTVQAAFPPTNSYFFAAVAVYGVVSSAYSNIYHYVPGGDAPQNLTAMRVTDHVQLDWEAPAGGAPDGYNAYIGTDDTLSDALKINAALITGLTFNVPVIFSPDQVHYFGVKASTGGTEGAFSNIFFYDPGAGPDTTPPVWQGPPGILTVAPEDSLVTVTWSPAVDADTPPVEYLLYYVEEGSAFDWDNPNEIYDSTVLTANVLGLQNDVRYLFAVKAQDSVTPVPNITTNENFLYAMPMVFPDNGAIGTQIASDVASVRMVGEEIPRIVSVNHTDELWYSFYDGAAWISTDLNTFINDTDRKYHPQILGVGEEVHIVYGTPGGIFEIYGQKDEDPALWTQKAIVASGNNNTYGIGFSFSIAGGYFAVVYATKVSTEQLFYSDRDAAGNWNTPVSIMDGNPQIWQCDMALNEFDGSQWVVAANGQADSTGDDLKFYFAHRDSRTGIWTGGPTGFGGDVMVVEIDPTIHQPVVACAEVRVMNIPLAGDVPVSDATVFTWDGSGWLKNVLEQGDCVFDSGEFTLETVLTGQDPQLVFSPAGKAVALWSKLDLVSYMLDETSDMTGDWRYSQRTDTTWGTTKSMLAHICSSNSVTAGDGYQHGVTCDLGMNDSGDTQAIFDKYSTRNDYVEGDLYYRRQTW